MAKRVVLARLTEVVGWALVVAYLAQYVKAPPNSTEGGVVFNYVDRIASGQRVYVDLFDYYGPVTWYLPSLFYLLGKKTVIGIRIYLLLVKLVTVWIGHGLVRRFAGTYWAVLAAATLTALVGLPWASAQVPYAAHLAIPLAMGTWWLVLSPERSSSVPRLTAAALMTAAAIWTKVTSGGFVLAGVAFYLFYWDRPPQENPASRRAIAVLRALQIGGLLVYALVFHAFVRAHLNLLFFLYLSLPLWGIVAFTALHVLDEWHDGTHIFARLRSTATYVALTMLFSTAYLFAYFGTAAKSYLLDEIASLRVLRYEKPFPPIGVPGLYAGFNEWLWPELPLLTTITLLAAIIVGRRRKTPSPDTRDTPERERILAGLGAMVILEGFVIYSRAGEPQLIQAIVPSAAALFVFASHLECPSWRSIVWPRRVLAVAVVAGISTIFAVPLPGSYSFGVGQWGSPRLAGLPYHPPSVPYFTFHRPGERYDMLDASLDSTARQLASLSREGETVLVLSETELLTYASETEPVGGRYSPLFYLLRAGMLDREGFLSLLPRASYRKLVDDPPRLVVSEDGKDVLLELLPELAASLRGKSYRVVGRHGFFTILQRDEQAQSNNE